jgi:hypothetical protein
VKSLQVMRAFVDLYFFYSFSVVVLKGTFFMEYHYICNELDDVNQICVQACAFLYDYASV